MRAGSGHIFDTWNDGGPFIGDGGKPHVRATVEIGWVLREWLTAVGDFKKPPLRYYRNAANDQVETEIPNVTNLDIEMSIDQDASTCTLQIRNHKMPVVGEVNPNPEEFGSPGYYTFSRGDSPASTVLWGHVPNEWNDVLVPNALIRTYEGFGGTTKTIAQALTDGNIILSGVWLVDETRITTGGGLEIRCRSMAKLLLEQPLFPPLIPFFDVNGCDVYPLRYQRFFTLHGTQSEKIPYGSDVDNPSARKIFGIEYSSALSPCVGELEGYWLAGDDGGVFSYGYVNFFGSRHNPNDHLNLPVKGMTATKSNQGYWLVAGDGGVFSFGDAEFYGSVPGDGIDVSNVVAIERSAGGNGYFLAAADGGVFAYGDAVFDGSGVGVITGSVVGMDVDRTGTSGYWLCTDTGHVYAFGGAGYFGGVDGAEGPNITGFAASPSGNGYYILKSNGAVFTFGDAVYHGSPFEDGLTLNDPATDMAVHPDGIGYWIAALDGGVFTYGAGMNFYGSLPGPWVNLRAIDGNYFDYTDIVRDLLIWSGFWINDGGINPAPYANLESTGIYNWTDDGALPDDLFDKATPIDVINKLKAVVGYLFWVDDEGAAHFESPNWWSPGNFVLGFHTNYIPEINEGVHMTDYAVSYNDDAMRSRILIASATPDKSNGRFSESTVVTDFPSSNIAALRGLHKPFMWTNKLFIKPEEQLIMAELIDLHINFQRRLGSVSCVANPLLQINDQVRILERETSETYIHYVRTINRSYDKAQGTYTMNVATNWLGDQDEWAIYTPSTIVRPGSAEGTATFPGVVPQITDPPIRDLLAEAQTYTASSGSLMTPSSVLSTTGEGAYWDSWIAGPNGWIKWTAPSDGLWQFDTIGSLDASGAADELDMILAIYPTSGPTGDGMNWYDANDDLAPRWYHPADSGYSRIVLDAVSGTTYAIFIGGYFTDEIGTYRLNWAPFVEPAPGNNIITGDDFDFEGGLGSWTAEANCTIATATDRFGGCMEITITDDYATAGDATVVLPPISLTTESVFAARFSVKAMDSDSSRVFLGLDAQNVTATNGGSFSNFVSTFENASTLGWQILMGRNEWTLVDDDWNITVRLVFRNAVAGDKFRVDNVAVFGAPYTSTNQDYGL